MEHSARIPVDDMMSVMASGEATPLLGEYDVGPTWYDGVWWHVPTGEMDDGFVQADAESAHRYYEMFVRLAASAVKLAEQFATDPPEVDDVERDTAQSDAESTERPILDWSDLGGGR